MLPWSSLVNVSTLIIVLLLVLLIGGLPVFPHSRKWGYGPSGLVGLLLIVLVILVLLGKL